MLNWFNNIDDNHKSINYNTISVNRTYATEVRKNISRHIYNNQDNSIATAATTDNSATVISTFYIISII